MWRTPNTDREGRSSRSVTDGFGPSSNVSASFIGLAVRRSVGPNNCDDAATAPQEAIPAAAIALADPMMAENSFDPWLNFRTLPHGIPALTRGNPGSAQKAKGPDVGVFCPK